MEFLKLISSVIGWTYVLCWSVSFYPQMLLNIKLKSSDGVSIDFLYLNTLGYVTYLTSLLLQVYSKIVRAQFYEKYGDYPLLSFIDVVYALHGLVLNLVIASQIHMWHFTRNSSSRVHNYTRYIFIFFAFIIILQLLLVSQSALKYVDIATNLAYIKICISFLKYIPQLYHNICRQSCHGFSIMQIWLDFAGGIFAVIQLFLDSYIDNDKLFRWSEILHNKGKLGLSMVTFFFDICFITQYYVVYPEQNSLEDALLKKDDNASRHDSSELRLPSSLVQESCV